MSDADNANTHLPPKPQQIWQLQVLCRHYIFEWKPEKHIPGNIL